MKINAKSSDLQFLSNVLWRDSSSPSHSILILLKHNFRTSFSSHFSSSHSSTNLHESPKHFICTRIKGALHTEQIARSVTLLHTLLPHPFIENLFILAYTLPPIKKQPFQIQWFFPLTKSDLSTYELLILKCYGKTLHSPQTAFLSAKMAPGLFCIWFFRHYLFLRKLCSGRLFSTVNIRAGKSCSVSEVSDKYISCSLFSALNLFTSRNALQDDNDNELSVILVWFKFHFCCFYCLILPSFQASYTKIGNTFPTRLIFSNARQCSHLSFSMSVAVVMHLTHRRDTANPKLCVWHVFSFWNITAGKCYNNDAHPLSFFNLCSLQVLQFHIHPAIPMCQPVLCV